MVKTLNLKTLKSKPFKIKITRKNARLTFSLAVFFIVSFSIPLISDSLIRNSNPGDLLFSIKQGFENSEMPADLNQKVNFKLNILKDRINGASVLGSQNQCVQLVLAEQSIFTTLSELSTLEKNNLENSKTIYEKIYRELQDLKNVKNCELRSETKALPIVYKYLTVKKEVDGETINFDIEIKESEETYAELLSQAKQTSFTNQEILNKINKSLAKAEENINNFRSLKSSDLISLNNILEENNFIYSYLNSILNNQKNSITQEDVVRSICEISNDTNCENDKLQSKWNSIYSKEDPLEQIKLGREMIEEYISRF